MLKDLLGRAQQCEQVAHCAGAGLMEQIVSDLWSAVGRFTVHQLRRLQSTNPDPGVKVLKAVVSVAACFSA